MQISLLIKPVAEVTNGTSPIYLFPRSQGIVGDYCGLTDEYTASGKFRKLLPFIASLVVPRTGVRTYI